MSDIAEEQEAYTRYLHDYKPLLRGLPPLSFEEWKQRMAEKRMLLGETK